MRRLSALWERVSELEAAMSDGVCNCRREQDSFYHGAAELAAILAVPCPLHRVRDFGRLVWLPSSLPLLREDRDLCACSPCRARLWRERRRGPLTARERLREYLRLRRQLSGDNLDKFRDDQVRAKQLLQRYARQRRRHNGTMRGKD